MVTSELLLTDNDIEEELSWVYVRAVASIAEYTVSVENKDRGGIDLRIHGGGPQNPFIALQLKATTNLHRIGDEGYRYPLRIEDYRRLIRPSHEPRYLIVLDLPRDKDEWLEISDEKLTLRRCAFWVFLEGLPESDNRSSVTVSISPDNVFDPDALRRLIEGAMGGTDGYDTR